MRIAGRAVVLIGVCAAHGLALYAASAVQAAAPRPDTPPITVSLLMQAPVAPSPRPEPPPPRSQPQPRKPPPEPEPRAVAPAEVASEATVAEALEPQVETAPAPAAPAEPVVVPPDYVAAYLDNPAPAYPALSRELGETGTAWLRVRVGADGRAQDVEVRTGSGHARLDQAALRAVRQWRFVPARRGEEPVVAWVEVPITFELKKKKSG